MDLPFTKELGMRTQHKRRKLHTAVSRFQYQENKNDVLETSNTDRLGEHVNSSSYS